MLPAACHKRAYRVLDERGRLVRDVEAPLTPEQRVLRDAEEAKKQRGGEKGRRGKAPQPGAAGDLPQRERHRPCPRPGARRIRQGVGRHAEALRRRAEAEEEARRGERVLRQEADAGEPQEAGRGQRERHQDRAGSARQSQAGGGRPARQVRRRKETLHGTALRQERRAATPVSAADKRPR